MFTDEEQAEFDRFLDHFDIQKVVNTPIAVGDTFTMNVVPRVGWFRRVLIRLRLVSPPKAELTMFTVTGSLTS